MFFCDWLAVFLGELGAKGCLHDMRRGMLLSSLFIFGTAVLCCVAPIFNIDLVRDAPIATLELANRMSLALGLVFTVVIFVGIYTSAVPFLWTDVKTRRGSRVRAVTELRLWWTALSDATPRAWCPTRLCSTYFTARTATWVSL